MFFSLYLFRPLISCFPMNGDLMVDLIAGRETLRVSEGLGLCSQIIQDNQVFLPPHCRNLGGICIFIYILNLLNLVAHMLGPFFRFTGGGHSDQGEGLYGNRLWGSEEVKRYKGCSQSHGLQFLCTYHRWLHPWYDTLFQELSGTLW